MKRLGTVEGAHGNGPEIRRLGRAVLCGLFLLVGAGSLPSERADAGQAEPRKFSIPSQPLAAALDAYCLETGVQVLYDSKLAAGRRSGKAEGVLTPEAALRALLQGTNLGVRYTASHDIVLALIAPEEVHEAPPPTSGATLFLDTIHVEDGAALGSRPDFRSYAGLVEEAVQRALYAGTKTRSGRYDIALKLWVDPSGSVMRAEISRSTGDRERDAAITGALHGLAISKAPPAGMPQPVSVAILAHPR
ncbi:hypothetical protein GCM10011611_62620 [Aliidongia dinghuensis]|uniref:Secretin/TonB short N-terminal domain-containing protein n=1 Tax=Aliidongia dinghuensis TaxID=1867774 RepID=A0A8J2Z1W4_9PROT|nr:TonB C-terminal domain-containing protein [Aliidongia dinghuensis]GGF47694.1 hypothetical protein GCM10011611_62620 [Aliidongia dinghuensis]